MYNNEVTYDKKWDTPENRAALEKLRRKYFDSSECSPDCPVAWAPEVLELFEMLDKELGFCHNESTMRGYYIQGDAKKWFLVDPWKNMIYTFYSNVFKSPKITVYHDDGTRSKKSKPIGERITDIWKAWWHSIGYGLRAVRIRKVNPILNRIQKNKIRLGQLKEKYGELTVYFSAPDVFEEFIDQEIRKVEIKLAMKGAYYPIESFWDSSTSYSVGTEYRPDIITTKVDESDGTIDVTKTTYRSAMKELGLDLKEIQAKAELRKAMKADPQNVKNP